MGANFHRPQNLGTCADVDMALNHGKAFCVPATESYLMEDEAIDTNFCIGVNDDSVWVGN